MQLVRDVVVDLWNFMCGEVRSLFSVRRSEATTASAPSPRSAFKTAEEVLQEIDDSAATVQADPIPTLAPLSPVAPASGVVSEVDHPEQYIAYPDTPCHLRPALVLDTIIGVYSYGTKVSVLSRRDDWVHVRSGALEGWIERFALTPHAQDVFPEFAEGAVYDAEHPETIKLRTYIADEFSARTLRLPVVNTEYVWYRLLRDGRTFSWPTVRPRTAGRWREILRTEPSVHVSSVPLTGSVMEYTDESSVGHLYYVESVTPEEGVVVSGFAASGAGSYEHQRFTASAQRTLHAAFLCKT